MLLKPHTPEELRERLTATLSDAPSGVAETVAAGAAHVRSLRVLVADDSPINLEVAAGLLELMGHQPITVDGGEAALERLATDNVDVVLMDIDMPDLDGLTATRRWRTIEGESGTHVTIFAMSAHVGEEVRRDGLSAGMDGFLSKPVDPREIQQALAGIARMVEANIEPEQLPAGHAR